MDPEGNDVVKCVRGEDEQIKLSAAKNKEERFAQLDVRLFSLTVCDLLLVFVICVYFRIISQ